MLPEFLVPVISFVFIFIYIFQTKTYKFDVIKFPYFIFGLMVFFAVGLLYKEYKIKADEKSKSSSEKEKRTDIKKVIENETKPVLIFLMTAGYIFLLSKIGYILATLFFLVAIMVLLKARVKTILIFSPIVTIFIYVLFSVFFHLSLPKSFLETWIRGLL